MKKITCHQLGGACDLVFEANTFQEAAKMSKDHGTEMFQKKDKAHLDAMNKMRELMHTPDAMQIWMKEKEDLFNSLPHI